MHTGGRRNYQKLCDVEKYDPLRKEWTHMDPISVCRADFGLAANGGTTTNPYGAPITGYIRAAELYNVIENNWTEFPSSKQAVFFMSAAFLNNELYVCGGTTKYGFVTNCVE
ncbi:hypothetical protein ANCDUO_17017, partial [Ancylostoma duodenale]